MLGRCRVHAAQLLRDVQLTLTVAVAAATQRMWRRRAAERMPGLGSCRLLHKASRRVHAKELLCDVQHAATASVVVTTASGATTVQRRQVECLSNVGGEGILHKASRRIHATELLCDVQHAATAGIVATTTRGATAMQRRQVVQLCGLGKLGLLRATP